MMVGGISCNHRPRQRLLLSPRSNRHATPRPAAVRARGPEHLGGPLAPPASSSGHRTRTRRADAVLALEAF
jgi:hypothetical protein